MGETGGERAACDRVARKLLEETQIYGAVSSRVLAWAFRLKLVERPGQRGPVVLADRLFYDPRTPERSLRRFVADAVAERVVAMEAIRLTPSNVRCIADALLAGLAFEPATGEWPTVSAAERPAAAMAAGTSGSSRLRAEQTPASSPARRQAP